MPFPEKTAVGGPEPEIVEAELVDEPVRRVDLPPSRERTLPWQSVIRRRPVVPPWMRDGQQRADARRWAAGFVGHAVLFHTARLPNYALRTAVYTPRGVYRLADRVLSWATDAEAAPLFAEAIRKEDADTYLKLSKQRAPKTHARQLIVLVGLVAALVGGMVGWLFAPVWALYAAAVGLVGWLGYVGRPIDRPWIGPAVVVPQVQRLTSGVVVRALQATLPALAKKDAVITFPSEITRDGPGFRADVELPWGVTAGEVMEERPKLASGLRRPLGCVWPEPCTDEHPGWLVLWVGDQDMRKARQPEWPLLKRGKVDLFEPQPFATDQRGRWVPVTLMFASMAIGAVPRVGKTFAVRELLLVAALDPRAQIYAYDLKGTGDLSPLECVAHRYGVGDEDDAIAEFLDDMRELQAELRRRTKVIRDLPKDLCPENKVTPGLAGKRSLGLWPIVVGIDECQRGFEHKEYGKELTEIVTDLVKRGPALGIIVIVATQRPDAKSLPTGIADNVVLRFCLRVMGQVPNDMVLGTSSYQAGIRATMFSQEDKGIGILRGEGADPKIVRTVADLDAPAAEKVALRAHAMRQAAGTLTGYCVGEQVEKTPQANLLDDLQVVYAQAQRRDRPGVWSVELVAGLKDLRPEVYGGWDQDTLAAALKPYALQTTQINMLDVDGVERHNWRGVRREALEEALAVRAERRGPRAVIGGLDG